VTSSAAARSKIGRAIPTLPKLTSAKAIRKQAAAKRWANTEVRLENLSVDTGMAGRICVPPDAGQWVEEVGA
jgi:hypothetical protein